MAEQNKIGVLVINLGTPESPEPTAVGSYLREFLMDKWVIDLPWPLRWFLVNALIVPKRKFASAKNYQKIWTDKGSPLLVLTSKFSRALQQQLNSDSPGDRYVVAMGMRYGKPSLQEALEYLKDQNCERVIVLPLYPQYAESTTRSSLERVQELAANFGFKQRLVEVRSFYAHTQYLSSLASSAHDYLGEFDHLLMSFHGLPERQVKKVDPLHNSCLKDVNCCEKMSEMNQNCYRAQCFATAQQLAKKLGLDEGMYSVAFQSRLGKTPWIRPYTDEVLEELVQRGVKRLAVICPSFIVDCLETLEEIQIGAGEKFRSLGGERFLFIPCLNSSPEWVRAASAIVLEQSIC